MIYLDNAATTLYKPDCVAKAVYDSFSYMGNAGRGAHGATLDAGRVIYETRELLADLFEIEQPERIAFTCNATEALNIAIQGVFSTGDHVITTVCEHNSVLRPLYRLKDVEISFLPTKAEEKTWGCLDYDQLETLLQPNTKGIVITHASNLTGNITDLELVSNFAKKHHLILIVDASQSAGVLPISVKKYGIDILCFTGHKGLMGPQGTGGIYVSESISVPSFKVGGSGIHSYEKVHPAKMPVALEAGTLNGHGITGLNASLKWILKMGVDHIYQREHELLTHFLDGIKMIPGIHFYGNPDLSNRVAIASINLEDCDSNRVSDWLLEDYDIAVRSGAHCAPLMHEALGTKNQGAVRFSFSYFNTEEDVEATVRAIKELMEYED